MTMTIREYNINKMIDAVVNRYGMEAKQTIKFCKICEGSNWTLIQKMYQKLMK